MRPDAAEHEERGRAPRDGRAAPELGPDEPPPVLGSWPQLYALVLGNLALLVALFYLFTKRFE